MCLRAVGQAVVQPAVALSQWQRFRPVPLATTQGTQAQTHRQIEPSTSLNIPHNGYPVNRIPIVHPGSVGVLALCGLHRESALQVQEGERVLIFYRPLCVNRRPLDLTRRQSWSGCSSFSETPGSQSDEPGRFDSRGSRQPKEVACVPPFLATP